MDESHLQNGESTEVKNVLPPAVPPPLPVARCTRCLRTIDASDRYCRHCGQRQDVGDSWYYHPVWILVLAYTVLGPFALYFVGKAPKLSRMAKILMTIAIIVPSIIAGYYFYQIGSVLFGHWMEFSRQMNELRLR